MKLVKKIRLVFREGKSDKVYEVDLVELPGDDAARFLVNFRFGRRGSALREGTKTVQPIPLAEAEAVYQSIVVSKTNSGYWDESGSAPAPSAARAAAGVEDSGQKQAARIAALLNALRGENDSTRRARVIWNLGQGDAAGNLGEVASLANRGDWIEDYSIAWTLGRWRNDAAVPTLEKLRRHANANVREMALESLLLTLTPSAAAGSVFEERAELPPALRAELESGNEAALTAALQALEKESSPALNRALTICYRIALFMQPMQRALLAYFAGCELAPGVFKGLRHVFKTAELRVDYDMYACLAHRFETTEEFFENNWDSAYIPGKGRIVVSKELPRENSRLAYSNRTRTYLRKRAWRAMRRLGLADSAHYVALAVAVLLRVSDADATQPRTSGEREYDEFAHLTLFNHILRGAHPAYRPNTSARFWYRRGNAHATPRGEHFAHLWNRAPAAALELLKRSRCGVVHDSAIQMLAGQTAFLDGLSAGEVAQLLQSAYAQTSQFALPLARALFERGAGDENLLISLLRSPLQQAREFGVQLLKAQSNWSANLPLLIELLLSFAPPVPELVDAALATAALPESDQQQVVSGVITQLLARNLDLPVAAAETLAGMLTRRLPAAAASVPVTLLDRLLSETAAGRQVLGARLLVASSLRFTEIPGRLLQHINGSPHEEVRAIAIALLAKQTPEGLMQQIDNLVELLHRGNAVERREMLGLFDKLAAGNPAHEARVLRALSALLFRADREPGQAEEIIDFFKRHQLAAGAAFDKTTVWRLLQAQATAAQRAGAMLLQSIPPAEFSVKQWARLGQHADLSVRRFAMSAFETHEPLVKQNARDALRLLDTAWPEAREFGFRYFRERFGEDDWAPEYIIGVCDSTQPEVQAFGRELLQRFFQLQQGPQYLATLSEHPSINVQLFVSNFLENHAAGQRERILGLRGYFVTVLSQINKARVCKDRVLAFLLRESLRDAEVAGMVAEVFTRVSLTVVNRDRSQLIKALIALQVAYPSLSVPIKVLPVGRTPRTAAPGAAGGI
jgi:hypothetical protein